MNADTPQPSERVEATDGDRDPLAMHKLVSAIVNQPMENEGEGTIEDMRYAYDENEAIIQEHNRVEVLIASHTARAVAAAVKGKDEEIEKLSGLLGYARISLQLGNGNFIHAVDDLQKRGFAHIAHIGELNADLTACRAQLASRDAEIAKFKGMPALLLECRNALPAITQTSARLHGISLSLADRIETALEPRASSRNGGRACE
jgi:hypothetical protein